MTGSVLVGWLLEVGEVGDQTGGMQSVSSLWLPALSGSASVLCLGGTTGGGWLAPTRAGILAPIGGDIVGGIEGDIGGDIGGD